MCPELLAEWALGVEAVENRRQFFFGDTGSLIFDGNENRPAIMSRGQPDLTEWRAERYRIPDNVAEHLGQSCFDPGHDEFTVLVADRNRFEGSYSLPNIDVNYGLGNRIQLKFELPLSGTTVYRLQFPSPVTSGCQLALTDSKFMPFSTSVRIKAPTKVPGMMFIRNGTKPTAAVILT